VSLRRQYGDAIAHSFGLTGLPMLRTRPLCQSQVAISRLPIGPEQIGMTPRIPPEDTFIVAMYLTDVPHHELWSHGRCVLRQGYVASSVRIVNLSGEYSAHVTCPHETLVLYVPRLALDDFTDEAGTPRVSGFNYSPGHVDPVMAHLAAALLPSFQRPNQASQLFIDHLTVAMLTHLCSHYAGPLRDPPYRKGGMTQCQVKRAKEFLAGHSADDVLLLDAARACGLSRGHFTNAFRVATGLTPHQWLQRYRIDKAKGMLLNAAIPIAEIAAACGFADQSHLTRVFARLVGSTPAAWRRGR
jgi:AraC family transcriptional regulator